MNGDKSQRLHTETERLRAENKRLHTELQSARQELQLVRISFENAAEGMLRIGPGARILDANATICRRLGYSRAELLAMSIPDIDPQFTPEEWPENWQDAKKKRASTIESVHRNKNGDLLPVEITINFFEYEGNEYVCSFIRDIRERKEAEQTLRMTQFAVDNAKVAITWLGSDARFTYVNDAACRNLGYTREEMLEMTVHEINPNFPAEAWTKDWQKVKQHGAVTIESCHRRKNGSTFPVELTINHLQFDGVEYHCAFARDISERKETEQVLQAAEERYRMIWESTPDAIILLDTESMIRYANPAVKQVFGYEPAEIIGNHISILQPECYREQHREGFRHYLKTGEKKMNWQGTVAEGLHKDGHEVPIEAAFNDMKVAGKRWIVGVIRDITERKQAALEIERLKALYEEILDNLPVEMAIFDSDNRYQYVNPAGLSEPEMRKWIIGKTNHDYCRKTGRDHGIAENRERWYRRTFEEKKTFGFVESLKTKTGEVKHFLRRFKPIVESDGEVRKIIAYGLDMTEQEQTQIALRESEERYRSLVELSPDAVIVHRDDKIVFINAAGARAVGARLPEELLGRPVIDFVHPDYRKFAQERIRRMAKGEGTPRVEEKFLRLDGTSFDVEIAARPITFDGQPAFQVIAHDITGRKRTQAQLQASYHLTDTVSRAEDIEEIYQESLSGLERTLGADRSAILLIDSDGVMRFKAWRGLSRHYRQAVAGHAPWPPGEKNPQPLLIPNVEDEPAIETFRPAILAEGIRAVAFIPLLYQGRLLGKLMIYYNTQHPFSAEEVQLAQTIARHVAFAIARKKSEQALRQSEQRYRTLVEQMPDGVYRSTPGGKFLEVNPAFVKMLGYESKEALLAVDIEKELYFEPQERQRVVDSLRQAGKDKITVFRLRHKDSHEIWVEDHGKMVCDAKGAVRYHEGILRDVTARKRAEEEHRRLEAQIQHAQKLESLGVLAGGIAHDFNNLLTGILGNASLALMDIVPASPTHECLEDIEKAAKRAADLCNQMLAYSGKGRFIVEPLRLSIVTEEMTHLLKTSISKKVVLKYEFYPNLPAIQADATQIRQVVMNLVINASDAIGDSPGVITVRTGLLACDDHFFREVYLGEELPVGQYVYLEVTDTGCGMETEIRAKIFDPFFTTKFTGRGLGLASVLGIVRGHGGAIKIESEPGYGTTFTILFPRSNQEVETSAADASETEEWRGSGTVLVVDDEQTIRDLSRRVLERAGFTVLTASDGVEAIDRFREHAGEMTAVLLDMTMPRLNGVETLRALRRLPNGENVLVILSSGYNEPGAATQFGDKGFAAFIHKPYTSAELIAKVQDVLEQGVTFPEGKK